MLPNRGWFWYIPLPEDIVCVGVVASPDYLFRDGKEFEAALHREIAACKPLSAWLLGSERVGPVRGLWRLDYINQQIVGDGWVMVGDAAGFLDPICFSSRLPR